MKKWLFVVLLCLMLTGCSKEAFETMSDLYEEPKNLEPAQVLLMLPQEAALMTPGEETAERFYLCKDFTLSLQTLPGGDMEKTLKTVSGYSKQQLSLVCLSQGDMKRYELVWAVAGEQGDEVARAVILDDGKFHYVLTLQTPADRVADLQQTWNELMSTFSLDTVP